MGLEKKTNNNIYLKYSEMEKGDTLKDVVYDGFYQGGKFNSITHYFIDNDSGAVYGLPGCKELNVKLANIDKGIPVEVTFNGKEEIKTKHGISNVIHVWVRADLGNGLEDIRLQKGDISDAEEGIDSSAEDSYRA